VKDDWTAMTVNNETAWGDSSPRFDGEKFARRQFRLFLLVHFLLWTFVPLVVRSSPFGDSIEALAWGMTWEWGTVKHPPLAGWLLAIANRFVGSPDFAIYALSQLCVLVALISVYRLARRYLPSQHAVLCAMFLEGTIYYTYNSPNYNPNVLSLALVPLVVCLFSRAVADDGWIHWLAAGFFGGMALLAKYTNGLILLSLGLYLLFTERGRERLRCPGPYLAVILAALVFSPHAIWLAHYDFPLHYIMDRMSPLDGYARQIILGFGKATGIFLAQFLKIVPTLALFAVLHLKTSGRKTKFAGWPDPFLIFSGLLPVILMSALTGLFGTHFYPKYSYAFLWAFPLLLFLIFPFPLSPVSRRLGIFFSYVVMAVSIGYMAVSARPWQANAFDGRSLAAGLERVWRRESANPMRFVGGNYYLTCFAAIYVADRPRPFFQMDPRVTVWEDEDTVRKQGILVLAGSADEYELYRQNYPDLPEPRPLSIPMCARFGWGGVKREQLICISASCRQWNRMVRVSS
jgi:hypothetical protein